MDYIQDPGHGWFKVSIKQLVQLGIADRISNYSYRRGTWAYLEEDCDLTKFFNAYHAVTGRDPKHRTRMSDRSAVRGYDRYTLGKAYASFMTRGAQ